MADLVRFIGKRGAEKGAHGDVESESHHFAGEVALLTITPAMDVVPGAFDHGCGVVVNSRAVKSGLRETALAAPKITLANEQTLAEKTLDNALGQFALVKFGLLDNEDLLDEVRMIEEDAILKSDGKADDVAVFASDAA